MPLEWSLLSKLLRSYQDEKFLVYSPYNLWMMASFKSTEVQAELDVAFA